MPALSLRAVNRATLDRQLLPRRHPLPTPHGARQRSLATLADGAEHGTVPNDPYLDF
jgi:hypothetical protein